MAGHTTPRSFRLWGLVAGHNVRVLIDSGACHNFICPKVVQLVGLETLPTSEFVVKVGNGQQVMDVVMGWRHNSQAYWWPKIFICFRWRGRKWYWVWPS